MLNRIFLIVLAASAIVTALLAYYAGSWLQSVGAPGAALEGFYYYSTIGWGVFLLLTAGLLVISNAILWQFRQAWPLWVTLLFFAVFTLLWYFWLLPGARTFALANGIPTPISALAPLSGAIFCLAAAALVYFDQFLVVRLNARMYPQHEAKTGPNPAPQPEIDADE